MAETPTPKKPEASKKPEPSKKDKGEVSKKARTGGTTGLLWWAFAATGLFYVLTDRREHIWDYLPYIMLMSCPLLDVFRRYSGHRRSDVVQRSAKPPWE